MTVHDIPWQYFLHPGLALQHGAAETRLCSHNVFFWIFWLHGCLGRKFSSMRLGLSQWLFALRFLSLKKCPTDLSIHQVWKMSSEDLFSDTLSNSSKRRGSSASEHLLEKPSYVSPKQQRPASRRCLITNFVLSLLSIVLFATVVWLSVEFRRLKTQLRNNYLPSKVIYLPEICIRWTF